MPRQIIGDASRIILTESHAAVIAEGIAGAVERGRNSLSAPAHASRGVVGIAGAIQREQISAHAGGELWGMGVPHSGQVPLVLPVRSYRQVGQRFRSNLAHAICFDIVIIPKVARAVRVSTTMKSSASERPAFRRYHLFSHCAYSHRSIRPCETITYSSASDGRGS